MQRAFTTNFIRAQKNLMRNLDLVPVVQLAVTGKLKQKGKKIQGAGAEYETLGILGSNCLVDDFGVFSKANDLCNRLDLNTISVGPYAAFTIEGFEVGLLPSKDLEEVRKSLDSRYPSQDGGFCVNLLKIYGRRTAIDIMISVGS